MRTAESTQSTRWQRFDRWWVPFSWVLIVPLLIKPIAFIVFYLATDFHPPSLVGLPEPSPTAIGASGSPPTYTYFPVVPTIIVFVCVGLLHFIPFLWLVSKQAEVRVAGIIAALLGIPHLLLPVVLSFNLFERLTNPDGVLYFRNVTDFWTGIQLLHLSWALIGAVIWFVSAMVWWSYGRYRKDSSRPKPTGGEYAMAAFTLGGISFGVLLAFFIHF